MMSWLTCRFLFATRNKKVWLALCSPIFISACMQVNNSSNLDASAYGNADGGPEFQAAREVFQTSCVPCHGYGGMSEDALIAQGLVVAQDPENSKIYYRLSGSSGPKGPKDMPQSGGLPPSDVEKIKVWINSL
jgi:hypothetical protein